MKISPEEKAFLDWVRDADDPSPAQREQVRRGLVAAMGGAAALSGAAAPAAASALASGATAAPGAVAPLLAGSGILVAKVVVVVALAGAAIGGGALLYTSSRSPAAHRISAPSAEARASLPSAGASPSRPQSAPGPSMGSASSELPARPAPTIVHAPPAAAPSTEDVPVSTLESETLLVRAADASLRAGDPATALTLLDEHARRFPRGVLEEERAEERVLALCALGRDAEARAATASFLRDHAKSPLVAKVRHSCAGDGSGAP